MRLPQLAPGVVRTVSAAAVPAGNVQAMNNCANFSCPNGTCPANCSCNTTTQRCH